MSDLVGNREDRFSDNEAHTSQQKSKEAELLSIFLYVKCRFSHGKIQIMYDKTEDILAVIQYA